MATSYTCPESRVNGPLYHEASVHGDLFEEYLFIQRRRRTKLRSESFLLLEELTSYRYIPIKNNV